MKIEFKKLPFTEKEFSNEFDSVKLEGTFCKISATLAKVKSTLVGNTVVECCRCGKDYAIKIDEELDFLLSDGVYENDELEELVFEVENSTIDFDQICESELTSIKSDYHICDKCLKNENNIEKEY